MDHELASWRQKWKGSSACAFDLAARGVRERWLSILLGFFFLLRSSEYLRKGAEVDEQKCLRFRNLTWARDDSREDVEPGLDCDELIVYHEYSKNDFMGQGQDSNIKRCSTDVRLCTPPSSTS